MRIAFLADIHSNFYALSAVLRDAATRKIDKYILCGDYLCDGPDVDNVSRVTEELTDLRIRGNREQYLLDYSDNNSIGWHDTPQFSSLIWIFNRISQSTLKMFSELPAQIRIELGGRRLNITHGSPYALRDNIKPVGTEAAMDRMLGDYDDDIFVFAHTHRQWNARYRNALFFNPGSVGMPTDSPGFKYSILEISNGDVCLQQHSVPYDYDAVAEYYQTNGFATDNPLWAKLFLRQLHDNKSYISGFVGFCCSYGQRRGYPADNVPAEVFLKAADIFFSNLDNGGK